jgi:hypothetical protein
MQEWIEGVHYYLDNDGWVVLTEKYLLEKGYCCGNGCRHCPYEYENVPDEKRRSALRAKRSAIRESENDRPV